MHFVGVEIQTLGVSGKSLLFSIVPTFLPWLRVEDANFPDMFLHMIKDEVLFQLCLSHR